MESLCLFNFGLRSRIRNISKIRQSNLFEHFLSTLKFLAISHGSFPCCSLTWLPITDRLCHVENVENDRGAVETSFVFFIACFYNKMMLLVIITIVIIIIMMTTVSETLILFS